MAESEPKAAIEGPGDIEAIVFIVLREAITQMNADLKALMEEVKARNRTKQAIRDLIAEVKCDIAANSGTEPGARLKYTKQGLGSEAAYHAVPLPDPDGPCAGEVTVAEVDLHPGPITNVSQLRAVLESLKGRLDSISELTEMESLRLQMLMDRRSKLISTLSNILKKIGETQNALVQNLK